MASWLIYLLVFLICFTGSAIQAVVGFGFLILVMALMPIFLPVGQVLVVGQFVGVFVSLWLIVGKFGKIDIKYIIFPAAFATAGSLVGLLFLTDISTEAYMKALGIVLIVLALWMWKLSSRFRIRATPVSGGACGLVSGVMGAIFGISVPPLVLYYSSDMSDKDRYMVSLQITLVIQSASCLLCRVGLGMWPKGIWMLIPFALAGSILGKYPGKWLYNRLDVEKLKKVIYVFIALMGVYTFLSN